MTTETRLGILGKGSFGFLDTLYALESASFGYPFCY